MLRVGFSLIIIVYNCFIHLHVKLEYLLTFVIDFCYYLLALCMDNRSVKLITEL